MLISSPLTKIYITQHFGEDPAYYAKYNLKGHHGIDLRAAEDTDGFAIEDGSIAIAQNGVADPLTGDYVSGLVCVLIGKQFSWWYLHCGKLLVTPGQKVKGGQKIIETGNTGASKAPHLHLGCRPHKYDLTNGYRGFVDPWPILKEALMFNEGDRYNVNMWLYGRDLGLHKPQTSQPFKEAMYSIFNSKEYKDNALANTGDITNLFLALTGKKPTATDVKALSSKPTKTVVYDVLHRSDAQARLGIGSFKELEVKPGNYILKIKE